MHSRQLPSPICQPYLTATSLSSLFLCYCLHFVSFLLWLVFGCLFFCIFCLLSFCLFLGCFIGCCCCLFLFLVYSLWFVCFWLFTVVDDTLVLKRSECYNLLLSLSYLGPFSFTCQYLSVFSLITFVVVFYYCFTLLLDIYSFVICSDDILQRMSFGRAAV